MKSKQKGEIITGLVMFWVGLVCVGAAIHQQNSAGAKVSEAPAQTQVAVNYRGSFEK